MLFYVHGRFVDSNHLVQGFRRSILNDTSALRKLRALGCKRELLVNLVLLDGSVNPHMLSIELPDGIGGATVAVLTCGGP